MRLYLMESELRRTEYFLKEGGAGKNNGTDEIISKLM